MLDDFAKNADGGEFCPKTFIRENLIPNEHVLLWWILKQLPSSMGERMEMIPKNHLTREYKIKTQDLPNIEENTFKTFGPYVETVNANGADVQYTTIIDPEALWNIFDVCLNSPDQRMRSSIHPEKRNFLLHVTFPAHIALLNKNRTCYGCE